MKETNFDPPCAQNVLYTQFTNFQPHAAITMYTVFMQAPTKNISHSTKCEQISYNTMKCYLKNNCEK